MLDAVLDLFAEGSLSPSPPDVAVRSGVSLRSVYRYYEDRDALVRAAIGRNLERLAPLLRLREPADGSLGTRLERLAGHRLDLYEAAAPTMRAARIAAPRSALVAERVELSRSLLRSEIEAVVAPELGGLGPVAHREAIDPLDVLFGFESLEHLRATLGRSRSVTARTLVNTARAVLERQDDRTTI